eukprot:m.397400 g.397400  ORF g.397400 m.397400 type:complete len:117 (-) comp16773_c2_seq4:1557-1907(-)
MVCAQSTTHAPFRATCSHVVCLPPTPPLTLIHCGSALVIPRPRGHIVTVERFKELGPPLPRLELLTRALPSQINHVCRCRCRRFPPSAPLSHPPALTITTMKPSVDEILLWPRELG